LLPRHERELDSENHRLRPYLPKPITLLSSLLTGDEQPASVHCQIHHHQSLPL
jgi:hypothetical protein